jgi:hypothetical protein
MMKRLNRIHFVVSATLLVATVLVNFSWACTLAVVSGRVTQDGRPILWKNRDFADAPHNEVAIFDEGKFRFVAVVNAAKRSAVWMGANEAGFCVANSLSNDLKSKESSEGPGNGVFMKLALETCATMGDFRQLLERSNETGRSTIANFAVIDARGGAAFFETGPKSYTMFDANDSQIAPNGFVVRSNFATSAQGLAARPQPTELADIYSSARYLRACRLLDSRASQPIQLSFVLQRMTRDLAYESGKAIPGSVNSDGGRLPQFVNTDQTISRTSTVSAAVFHGVQPGEDPRFTTMWTILGDPKFSLAVPCWPTLEQLADPVEDKHGAELCEIARTLRDASLSFSRKGVDSSGLPGIWEDLLPLENRIVEQVQEARQAWLSSDVSDASLTALHRDVASKAMVAMQRELIQAKEAALRCDGLVDSAVVAPVVRVAIYDHSDGSAKGPKNLSGILTHERGFSTRRVTPEEIQVGVLEPFDVLIMPGGSGSSQARHLQADGRDAVRRFVRRGGGYVGICAGSYLASSHYSWSLGLINARVWDRAHWARGTGMVRLRLPAAGQQLLDSSKTEVEVYYGQGPLLVPGRSSALPTYEVLAAYDSEIAAKGAPVEAMVGTHAIIASRFGDGRVICFSPHPEKEAGPHELMISGVRWAAGRSTQ